METNRLKYFCLIAEVGSLSKAAQILSVSHGGLSKAISALQAETKLQLFRPQGRGLEITAEGKWFYQRAQEILKIENEISNGIQTSPLTARIGLSEILAVTCGEFFAKEFSEPLSLIQTDIGEAERSLLNNELEFAFVFSPAPRSDLEYLELGEIKFNAHVRADLLAGHGAGTLPFAVPAAPFDFNPLGYKSRDGWPQDIFRTARFAVSGFAVALNLLRGGTCAVYMPNFVAQLESNIVKVPFYKRAETKRKLFLVKIKNATESKDMKRATKVVRKVCAFS